METKEQKIERLNKIIERNQLKMGYLIAFGSDKQIDKCWKEIEQAEQQLIEEFNTIYRTNTSKLVERYSR